LRIKGYDLQNLNRSKFDFESQVRKFGEEKLSAGFLKLPFAEIETFSSSNKKFWIRFGAGLDKFKTLDFSHFGERDGLKVGF
jgi:hypothetical protein